MATKTSAPSPLKPTCFDPPCHILNLTGPRGGPIDFPDLFRVNWSITTNVNARSKRVESLTYDIAVANAGPYAVANVVLRFALLFRQAKPRKQLAVGPMFTLSLASLAPGEGHSFTGIAAIESKKPLQGNVAGILQMQGIGKP